MTLRTIMSPLALSAAALTIASAALVAPARAQNADGLGPVFFLWGGNKEWGGGRQTVGFNQSFKPGQVVVSFGDRRLYLCTPDRPDLAEFVAACIRGGVDIVQLREKGLEARPLLARARIVRDVCRDHGVPFVYDPSTNQVSLSPDSSLKPLPVRLNRS